MNEQYTWLVINGQITWWRGLASRRRLPATAEQQGGEQVDTSCNKGSPFPPFLSSSFSIIFSIILKHLASKSKIKVIPMVLEVFWTNLCCKMMSRYDPDHLVCHSPLMRSQDHSFRTESKTSFINPSSANSANNKQA